MHKGAVRSGKGWTCVARYASSLILEGFWMVIDNMFVNIEQRYLLIDQNYRLHEEGMP